MRMLDSNNDGHITFIFYIFRLEEYERHVVDSLNK